MKEFVEWASGACIGESLDKPEVAFGYEVNRVGFAADFFYFEYCPSAFSADAAYEPPKRFTWAIKK